MFRPEVIVLVFSFCQGSIVSLPRTPGLHEIRIVGGEDADISEAPFTAALLYDTHGLGKYTQVCAGSIIREDLILTAAHCLPDTRPGRWRVRVGSSISDDGGQLMLVSKYTMHERYNKFADYDFGIVFLTTPIVFDNVNVAIATIAPKDIVVNDDDSVLTVGWGAIQEMGASVKQLQKVTLKIINQEECKKTYFDYNPVTIRMMCAGHTTGGKDSCVGDSGGPLIFDNIVVGITSWGKGCARPGSPSVWSRISSMRDWIDANSG